MTDLHDKTQPTEITAIPPKSRRRRKWLRCGCLVGMVILCVVIVGVFWIRHEFRSKFTPEEWSKIEETHTKVVSLPEKWHGPTTAPPADVVAFYDDFPTSVTLLSTKYEELLFGDYTSHTQLLQQMRRGDELSAEKETSLTLFLADLDPVMRETSRTVNLPGYTSELNLYGTGTSSFLAVQIFAKFTSIAALDAMRHGDAVGAMDKAAIALRLTKRPAQSQSTTHLICVAVSAITGYTFEALCDQTSDTRALKHGLALMTDLRSDVFPAHIENWVYGDSVGTLRAAAANGWPVNLKPQTMPGYLIQVSRLMPRYYQWIIQTLPPDDPRVRGAQHRLNIYYRPPIDLENILSPDNEDVYVDLAEAENAKPNIPETGKIEPTLGQFTSSEKMQATLFKVVMGLYPTDITYSVALKNYKETIARSKTALAMYDLTRVHFARRLAELEGTESAVSPGAGIATYLSPIPNDPFAAAPFKFSKSLNTNYSLAPDMQDDDAQFQYDSTNGTFSRGDLWMELRREK